MFKKCFIIFLSLLFSFNAWSLEISPKIQEQLKENKTIDAILYLKEKADLSQARSILDRDSRVAFVKAQLVQVAEESQKQILRDLDSKGLRRLSFYTQNAIAVFDYPSKDFDQLLLYPEIAYVGPNVKSHLKLPKIAIPEYQANRKLESHMTMINLDKAWDEFSTRGENIVIAGQDTGYLWNHDTLKKKYRGFSQNGVDHNYNWHDAIKDTKNAPCSSGGAVPCDDHDHGTHTMGTMVGDDEKGNQIGVAPGARWIGCRNMENGDGTVASYLSCFDFFMAPYPIGGDPKKDGRPDLAPHIVNNSWSCPSKEGCRGDEFAQVIQAYKAAGIMLVVAAGNDGPGCGTASKQPALYAGDVISVGAWNRYMNKIAFFSGRGPSPLNGQLSPNLIAPGDVIRSALASGVSAYDTKAGTSMAAPQIAGAVALMWSHKPELIGQIGMTLEILENTASPLKADQTCGNFPGSQIPNAVYGHGMLNVHAALKAL